jgi:hypothetical protein
VLKILIRQKRKKKTRWGKKTIAVLNQVSQKKKIFEKNFS